MPTELHTYLIKQNRFKTSVLQGMNIVSPTRLGFEREEYRHLFLSSAIDGIEREALWGRLHFSYEVEEDMVLTVYAVAVDVPLEDSLLFDPQASVSRKRQMMEELGAVKVINQNDILLYELSGRYLYIMYDVIGMGSGYIDEIQVNNKGDILMEVMPEVYQEYGSFFHRYLSIFTSLLLDFQKEIQHIDEIFDIDKAPAEMLTVLTKWMGIDISGDFLSEEVLRKLVKEAYQLNKKKGTKEALERLTEIILGEKALILEKNVFRDRIQTEDEEIYRTLYGDNPYDVTLLIKSYVPQDQKSQLMFLLNQFKPVRCRLLTYFLDDRGNLDRHAYLDINATIEEEEYAVLDQRQNIDGMIIISE